MSDFEKKTLGLLEEILSEVKHFNLKLPRALVTLKDIKDSLHVIEYKNLTEEEIRVPISDIVASIEKKVKGL